MNNKIEKSLFISVKDLHFQMFPKMVYLFRMDQDGIIEPILIVGATNSNISMFDDSNSMINVENELECFESEHFTNFQYTIDDILLACSTAATVFNCIVIMCAAKLFKRSGDTMHLFIISMTMGDLLLTGNLADHIHLSTLLFSVLSSERVSHA